MRHPHDAHARRATCAVLTVSDTRGPGDDAGGDAVARALEAAGHRVAERAYAKDEAAAIRAEVERLLAAAEVVVATGGTGVSPRDVTPEALAPLVDKALPGFGEAFRRASEADVGSIAWLSRAGAGVARGRVLAWLPGSPSAAALGARMLAEQAGHLLSLTGRA